MRVRQLVLNMDNALGSFLKQKLPAYISEEILTDGSGVYTCDEWSRARKCGYRNAGPDSSELDSNDSWLARAFQHQYRNFLSAQRLAATFNFRDYESVLELGCGEMVQAFVLTQLNPQLRYKVTDFDPFVIEKCSKLSLLSKLEKGVLDVEKLSADDLDGFQLLLAWEMFYALDDGKLGQLFRVAGEARIPIITGTTQLTGPFRTAIRYFKGLGGAALDTKTSRIRMHGWHHSLAYYAQMALNFNMKLKRVWYPWRPFDYRDNFTYILFTPV